MPSLLQTLAPAAGKPLLYDNWGWSMPGGITLDVSDTNPFRSSRERLAAYRGWIYVTVSTIAADMARLGVTIQDANGEAVPDHPALGLIRQPNPWYGANNFRQMLQLHLDLAGEFFVYVQRGENRKRLPERLHILAPDRVYVIPDPANYIQGYLYYGWSGDAIAFKADEVIHVRYANPVDPYRGASPVQALGFAPRINEGLLAYAYSYLANDARPGGVLRTDQPMTDEQVAQLRERWQEAHSGFDQRGRIAVLDRGLAYQPTAASLNDLNPKALDEWGKDLTLAAYNMPATKLGLTTNYNHSDAEAAERTYEETCLTPRSILWQQDMYQPLVSMFGPGYRAVIDNPSGEDRARIFDEALKQATAGLVSVQRFHQLIGSSFADEEPDVRILPPNVTIASELVDTPPAPQPPRGLPSPDRELQSAIRAAAAAEYADRKSGAQARSSPERYASVLGSAAAGRALAAAIDDAVRRDGLVAAYERLKGPGARRIAREWSSHAA